MGPPGREAFPVLVDRPCRSGSPKQRLAGFHRVMDRFGHKLRGSWPGEGRVSRGWHVATMAAPSFSSRHGSPQSIVATSRVALLAKYSICQYYDDRSYNSLQALHGSNPPLLTGHAITMEFPRTEGCP